MKLPACAQSAPQLIDQGQLEEALALLAEALQSEPNNCAVLLELGRLALKAGNSIDALSFFAEALVNDARCGEEIAQLGIAELERGNDECACLLLNLAERDAPEMGAPRLLAYLAVICQRFTRDYDPFDRQLRERLREWIQQGITGYGACATHWEDLRADLRRKPHLLDMLFPDACRANPEWIACARLGTNVQYLPSAPFDAASIPVDSLLEKLLHECATADPAQGAPFAFLSRFYCLRDLLYGYFVDPTLRATQDAIFRLCSLQRHHWQNGYVGNYLYQGLARLGLSGIKPTEERLRRYEITRWLNPKDRVLDIGANNGFLSLEIARHVEQVDGIEFNPYLVGIARLAAQELDTRNADFQIADFVTLETDKRYDAIFSLANHCTIDGHLSIGFELYVAKLFALLKPDGKVFFETHNVFGPGRGGSGDDGDLDDKFDIVERYFSVCDARMTRSFVPACDIDKLFVVLQRRPQYDPTAKRTLHRASAIAGYAD